MIIEILLRPLKLIIEYIIIFNIFIKFRIY